MSDHSMSMILNVGEWNRAKEALAFINGGESYRGMFRDTLPGILEDLAAYARKITHIETGTLAGSHTWEYDTYRTRGEVFISPRAFHVSGSRILYAKEYGFFEHWRGGSHAFYERTWKERGPELGIGGINGLMKRLNGRIA